MSGEARHFDPTTGQELRVNEPMRPDLRPGESVTYAPDRWCEACSQARGTRLCPICGGRTVLKSELSPVDAVPLSFERPMGVTPPVDAGAAELEHPELELPPQPCEACGQDDGSHDEAVDHIAFYARKQREQLERDGSLIDAECDDEEREHASVRGTRTQLEPAGDRARARQTEDVDVPQRRKRIVDIEPRPQRREEPYSVREKRRRVPVFNLPDRGAAMDRSIATTPRRQPQRVQEIDEGGREVHRTGSSRRARSLDDQYNALWDEAKIDKETWVQFACAAATSGAEPEVAANYADELYMQLVLRQQKQ